VSTGRKGSVERNIYMVLKIYIYNEGKKRSVRYVHDNTKEKNCGLYIKKKEMCNECSPGSKWLKRDIKNCLSKKEREKREKRQNF
jgi:hypothetical protein